jgi:hypothetical protein
VTACPLLSYHCMPGVLLMLEDEDGYGYIIMITVFTLPLMLTWVNVLLVYACSSL